MVEVAHLDEQKIYYFEHTLWFLYNLIKVFREKELLIEVEIPPNLNIVTSKV